eukprot:CAMPEP_0173167558 /NCGR_PEP_ID=MMETSP1105-20130129/22733_1 /TAXON_ID=2985 /ORGANISM="Ochromonas sp., Strain BG-1" /LENGTH=418 /DNA_ID=CAMNT_0014089119 /DNA_START=349 /DNA_END=1605 /DNA_ORIENTATION=+
MCRLTAYKGKPILIGAIVTKPNNSLLYQSRDAAYHPGVKDDTHRRNILVNGDGFGVAWYNSEQTQRGACCFKFVTPAWSNQNLQNIGDHVTSNLIFAHIRAASSGHDPFEKISVNHENCHPFSYGKFTFMHNGGIPKFSKIKLKLLNLLSETFFQEVKGSTDSEHMFALFLTILYSKYPPSADGLTIPCTVEDIIDSLNQMISTILHLCALAEIEDACSINICITDGVNIVATRFRNGPQTPPSLYYNYGSGFVCEDGVFYAKGGSKVANDIVISSAPLSKVSELEPDYCDGGECGEGLAESVAPYVVSEADIGSWILMPKDYMLICRGDPENPHRVASIDLKPVLVTEAYPGYNIIMQRKAKAAEKKVKFANLKEAEKKQKSEQEEEEERDNSNNYFPRLSSFLSRKPKIMRFRSKL